MSPKIKTIIVSILALLVYSCSKEIKPEEIEPHDICYLCKMAISQLNFATEIITPDGEVYKFDDIGCMIEFKKMRELPNGSVMFVRDFYTNEWVRIENAYFVRSEKIQTPMNYFIVTFKTRESVEKFLNEYGGEEFPYEQLEIKILK
ncbi:copper chaperone NosL [Candidatus Kryptobacter tengchongensis]|uniref:Copper chaperone NosL n=1 Tax=Kryptobacter tengchongensis TaxID=1643429 RepID=A0A656D5E1_KRYT1|nr:nitrous oxide reductase accessory protein NosL [Candidatus Kryptobacter tengchongensis]CUT00526.1 copper chaperone NosL [Candidatus Kryptobacter tengchongensis]CUT03273.1 copper chaperone NosL [Candidatus Kryptobacter tengchongensis]CUU07923.1 copper chaperone NosL [Candidatus Kryptobacter tengchongensis]